MNDTMKKTFLITMFLVMTMVFAVNLAEATFTNTWVTPDSYDNISGTYMLNISSQGTGTEPNNTNATFNYRCNGGSLILIGTDSTTTAVTDNSFNYTWDTSRAEDCNMTVYALLYNDTMMNVLNLTATVELTDVRVNNTLPSLTWSSDTPSDEGLFDMEDYVIWKFTSTEELRSAYLVVDGVKIGDFSRQSSDAQYLLWELEIYDVTTFPSNGYYDYSVNMIESTGDALNSSTRYGDFDYSTGTIPDDRKSTSSFVGTPAFWLLIVVVGVIVFSTQGKKKKGKRKK